jgi:parallel beta-helix repeat protein
MYYKNVFAAVGLIIIVFCKLATATVIHVPADYENIYYAIFACENQDTILVAPGVYFEHFSFWGKDIVIKSEAGPEVTTIGPYVQEWPVIKFIDGEPSTATLEGFTISNDRSDSSAVFISNSRATLRGNIFSGNYGELGGGAVKAVDGDSLFILNNVFRRNGNSTFSDGGAINYHGRVLICSGNEFYNNTTRNNGGAILLQVDDNFVVDHNLFVSNSCLMFGAAVMIGSSNGGEFFNNTLSENYTLYGGGGGGIVVTGSNNIAVYNNIIVNNTGTGVVVSDCSNCPFTYNNVWGNTIDYNGISPGIGSISEAPIFIEGDPFSYHLSVNSPCIDAGDPLSTLDPDGTRADLGPYYTAFSGQYGDIMGVVFDDHTNPLAGTIVTAVNSPHQDTTDTAGNYFFGHLRNDRTYDIFFNYPGYTEITLPNINIIPNDTTVLDTVRLTYIPIGCITGVVVDGIRHPIPGVNIEAINTEVQALTDHNGYFILENIPSGYNYTLNFSHSGYFDTSLINVYVYENDTSFVDTVSMRRDRDRWYISGDVNGSSDATPLADLIYGSNFMMGGPPPDSFYCTDYYNYAAMLVNGGCNSGILIGMNLPYIERYWRGEFDNFLSCPVCPTPQPDSINFPSGVDPGIPDSIIIGNLDLTPIFARAGGQVIIPIWVKNDEPVPAVNISLAADSACISNWIEGSILNPLAGLNDCAFMAVEHNQPTSGYISQTLLGWKTYVAENGYCLNTNGAYQQVAAFSAVINSDSNNICNTINIIPGLSSRSGVTAFCDSEGTMEWSPIMLGGEIRISSCSYVPGDINDNHICNGLDVVYGVRYFKGGPPPPYTCECTSGNTWYVAGDVNASCSFNGLDITYMVSYFKGGPSVNPCADCP